MNVVIFVLLYNLQIVYVVNCFYYFYFCELLVQKLNRSQFQVIFFRELLMQKFNHRQFQISDGRLVMLLGPCKFLYFSSFRILTEKYNFICTS